MSKQIEITVQRDQQRVVFVIQHEIALQPTTMTMSFDDVEKLYLQVLGASIARKEQAKQRVLKAVY